MAVILNLGINQQVLSLSRQLGGYLMQAAALATARNNLNLAARELASSLEVSVQARGNQSVNRDHDDFLRVSTDFIEYLNSASFQEFQQRMDSLDFRRILRAGLRKAPATLSGQGSNALTPPIFCHHLFLVFG